MSDPLSALVYEWDGPQKTDPFDMHLRRALREPESWRNELCAAAKMIGNTAGKPIWLALSGGFAGEIMARAFFDQGINFSALTLEYSRGINRSDVERAKQWCYKRGVPHEIVQIDTKAFLTDDVDAYIKEGYSTNRVYRYIQLRLLELIEKRGGFAVLGNGKINFMIRETESGRVETFVPFGTSFIAPFEWCERHHTAHQPYFFFSQPELLLAYFRMPLLQAALNNPTAFRNAVNNVSLRRFLYQTEWPEIESRSPFLGFERDKKLKEAAEKRMDDAFRSSAHVTNIPTHEIVTQLSPQR
jgi:hypothetical protein